MTEEDKTIKEFALEDFKLNPISSAETIKQNHIIDENDADLLSLNAAAPSPKTEAEEVEAVEEIEEAEDPIFRELSEPKLPELAKEDRARLQMQSPNRVHFYWSFKQNPFQTLKRVVGSQASYQLIVKLVNQTNDREELFPADVEGSAWFDVDADANYQAEIGFYAVNRPFVRVLFSNVLQTPRKNPSSRRDYSENFTVSASQFAEVLDASGFQQDAFEVALAGDDLPAANAATNDAFAQVTGIDKGDYDENKSSEMRFVLLALASGYAPEELRGHISPSLFAVLQSRADRLNAEQALAALQENFGVFGEEAAAESGAEESFGTAVFGASLVNFPRFSRRKFTSKFSPFSSLDLFN